MAKCDLVCVELKIMNKLVPNVFSPSSGLALLVRLVVEAGVDWFGRWHRVQKVLLKNWLRLDVKLTGWDVKWVVFVWNDADPECSHTNIKRISSGMYTVCVSI